MQEVKTISKRKFVKRIISLLLCFVMTASVLQNTCIYADTVTTDSTELPSESPTTSEEITKVPETSDAPEPTDTPVTEPTETPGPTATPFPVIVKPTPAPTPSAPADNAWDVEAYLLKNADRNKIGDGDALVPVDILYLSLTMANRAKFDHDPSLYDLWKVDEDGDGAPDHADAFLGQSTSYAVLYAPSVDSDYYAAKVDVATSDDMWVTDWGAADSRNGLGIEMSGVIYDKETGIAYVPKEYCKISEDGVDGMGLVRLQLLYAVSNEKGYMEATTNINLKIVNAGETVVSEVVPVEAVLPSTVVTVNGGDKIESVTVNGEKVSEDTYSYDTEKSALIVNRYPISIDTLEVEMSGIAKAGIASIATVHDNGNANLVIEAAWNNGQSTLNKGGAAVLFEYDPNGIYSLNGTAYYIQSGRGMNGYTMPSCDWYGGDWYNDYYPEALADRLMNDTWNLGVSELGHAWVGLRESHSNITRATNIKPATYNNSNGQITIPNTLNVNMECAHALSSALSSGTLIQDTGGVAIYDGADVQMNVLAVDPNSKLAMVGILVATIREQVGVGIFLLHYDVPPKIGYLNVYKCYDNPAIVNQNPSAYSLQGAVYALYQGTTEIARATTGSNGAAYFQNIPVGTYTLKEITPSKNCALDGPHTVTIQPGITSEVVSSEPVDHGTIKLTKEDVTEGSHIDYSMDGAQYTLYTDEDCSNPVSTQTVKDYTCEWTNLAIGTYWVKETKAPEHYKIDPNKYKAEINGTVTVNVTSGEVQDAPPGTLLVKKVSAEPAVTDTNSRYSFAGAKYAAFTNEIDANRNSPIPGTETEVQLIDGTWQCNITWGGINGMPDGTYYIKETVAPTSGTYELDPNIYEAVVKAGSTTQKSVTVTSKEKPNFGDIHLWKRNPYGGSLEGATYTLYTDSACTKEYAGPHITSQCGHVNSPATQTTNSSGDIYWEDLPIGDYYVKETGAPAGYEMDYATHAVTVTVNQTKSITATDTKIPTITISLDKYSSNPDFRYTNFSGVRFGVFTDSSCRHMVSSETIDSSNSCTIENLYLPDGGSVTYYVQELSTIHGFKLDPYVYSITLSRTTPDGWKNSFYIQKYHDSAGNLTEIEAQLSVDNEPSYNTFSMQKDIDYSYLLENPEYSMEGATYVFSTEADRFVDEYELPQLTTNAAGYASFEYIVKGDEDYEEEARSSGKSTSGNCFMNSAGVYVIREGTYYLKEKYEPDCGNLDRDSTASHGVEVIFSTFYDAVYDSDGYRYSEYDWVDPGVEWVAYMNDHRDMLQVKEFEIIHDSLNVGYELFVDLASLGIYEPSWTSGQIRLKKTSPLIDKNPRIADGAKYACYRYTGTLDSDLDPVQKYDGTKNPMGDLISEKTISSGEVEWRYLDAGWYFIRETESVGDFLIDPEIHWVHVSGYGSEYITSVEPEKGHLYLHKTSADEAMTNGNSYYDFEGVTFALYEDSGCTEMVPGSVKVISSDSSMCSEGVTYDGHTDALIEWTDIEVGTTYYVSEVVSSESFGTNRNVVAVEAVGESETLSPGTSGWSSAVAYGEGAAEFENKPFEFRIVVNKVYSEETIDECFQIYDTDGEYDMTGAEFTCYYAENIGTHRKGDVAGVSTVTGTLWTGYSCYFGNLPLGKYTVKETKPGKCGFAMSKEEFFIDGTPENAELRKRDDETMSRYAIQVTFTEPVIFGRIALQKVSADPDVTDGNRKYSKGKATYILYHAENNGVYYKDQMYHDNSSKARVTTNEDGYAEWNNICIGKYYIKEETRSTGYNVDPKIYYVEVTEDGKTILEVDATHEIIESVPAKIVSTEPVVYGDITLTKKSSDEDITGDNSYYSVKGAEFMLYYGDGHNRHSKGDEVGTATTNASGNAVWKNLELGEYYAVEQKAPPGYVLNRIPIYIVLEDNEPRLSNKDIDYIHAKEVFEDAPAYGRISLSKLPEDLVFTTGNSNYSLEGAQYQLRYAKTEDGHTKDDVVLLDGSPAIATTDKSGNATWDHVPLGSYYAVETKPSEGFILDPTEHPVTISADNVDPYNVQVMPIPMSCTSFEPEKYGTYTIQKESDNTSLTDGNSYYSYEGAEYTMYYDEGWSTQSGHVKGEVYEVQTTNADGAATWGRIPLGKYYVKETVAPPGYLLDDTEYPVTVTDNNGSYTNPVIKVAGDTSYEKPVYAKLAMTKKSSNPEITAKYPEKFSLAGAKYGLYYAKTEDGHTKDTLVRSKSHPDGLMVTDKDGKAEWKDNLPLGEYYVKEVEAPQYYELDKTKHPVSLTDFDGEYREDGPQVIDIRVNSTDQLQAYIMLRKVSSNPDMTDGNDMYNFDGVSFTLYEKYQNGICSDPVGGAMTLNEDNEIKWENLAPDTYYYVQETTTSESYQKNTRVYRVKAIPEGDPVDFTDVSGESGAVVVENKPKDDPAAIEITKIPNGDTTPTIPTLAGTEFTIKYYDGLYDSISDLPTSATRTWVLKVKKEQDGRGNTIYRTTLSKSYFVDGDELYYNSVGTPTLPLGTYTIQETKTAADYQIEGGFFIDNDDNRIASDEIYLTQVENNVDGVYLRGGNIFTGENEPTHDASIKIKKLDDDRNPLQGAHFQLKNSKGEVVVEDAVSDKDGIVTFDELYPDTYTITETQGVKGHMLLAEPLVVDVPTRLTEAEITEQNVDKDKVIYDPEDNIYYVNNLVYEISNAWKLDMPVTGAIATPKTFFPIVIGLSIMAVTAYFGIFRRRRDDVLED